MTKLFISYRRRSWPFTHRLADELRKHLDADIFVDYESIDEDEFESSILRNLRESDAVLLIISEHTFTDRIYQDGDWVRREIREALQNNIPIVLVAIEAQFPPDNLPPDIAAVKGKQGIPFYADYFFAAVDKLADFVETIGAAERVQVTQPENKQQSLPGQRTKSISGIETLREAKRLIDEASYKKAIFLLEELKKRNYRPRFVSVDDLLTIARQRQRELNRQQQAKREYSEILLLNTFRENEARDAWKQWTIDYPDLFRALDTDDLRNQFGVSVEEILPPPFEWIDIPAGQVTLKPGGYLDEETTFDVEPFRIAKYPITNAQYALFIEAGGYENPDYWTDAGWKVRQKKNWTKPRFWQDSEFNGSEQPVNGVSWYEAYAFTRWLGEITGEHITLPTEQQWQRAAQGDDNRVYPWGDEWANSRANAGGNYDSTTPVTKYEGKGDSPFGVVDMSGNVWEWCLTQWESGSDDSSGSSSRVLRAGAFGGNRLLARCASRLVNYPDNQYHFSGVRLVCGVPVQR
jgi:formylglycine-generating enzyme required for sulfatase activity